MADDGLVPPVQVTHTTSKAKQFSNDRGPNQKHVYQVSDGRPLLEPSHEKEEQLFRENGVRTYMPALIVVSIVDAFFPSSLAKA